MEIVLYTGEDEDSLAFFEDCANQENYLYKIDNDCLGHYIVFENCDEYISIIRDYICCFIIEFYLKESILTKIYDEYPALDANDGSIIMTRTINSLSESRIGKSVKGLLKHKKCINIESYVLFNIRLIMLTLYSIVDYWCENTIYEKEKDFLINMLNKYSELNEAGYKKSNVDFSLELTDNSLCNNSIYDE